VQSLPDLGSDSEQDDSTQNCPEVKVAVLGKRRGLEVVSDSESDAEMLEGGTPQSLDCKKQKISSVRSKSVKV